ncbi:hypothetical protein IP85_01755 [Rhizobium sp. AAP116]|nr:hypothetical protein IP85_01755 [Rhizobium sp. AAP116]
MLADRSVELGQLIRADQEFGQGITSDWAGNRPTDQDTILDIERKKVVLLHIQAPQECGRNAENSGVALSADLSLERHDTLHLRQLELAVLKMAAASRTQPITATVCRKGPERQSLYVIYGHTNQATL